MILDEAKEVVKDRQEKYGDPKVNHNCTALLWETYLKRRFLDQKQWLCGNFPFPRMEITARDVCIMNILQKISRDANLPNYDNLLDIIGFAENAARIEPRCSVPPVPPPPWEDVSDIERGIK